MIHFLSRRLLLTIPVLLGVATLVFSLIHLVPGDPVQAMLGDSASPNDIADLRGRLGLDRPLYKQYGSFLKGLAKGDLGVSLRTNQPVAAAIAERLPRASVLEELRELYVLAARARGVSKARAVLRHAFRNSLIPIVTVLGLQIGAVLTGAVITETIFAWPGVGRLLIQSISFRDYPMVQGCILLIAVTYMSMNLLTDVVYGLLDPRIRYE